MTFGQELFLFGLISPIAGVLWILVFKKGLPHPRDCQKRNAFGPPSPASPKWSLAWPNLRSGFF